jgi:hypothetical protein
LYRTTGERRYLDLAGYLLSGVERERLKLTSRDMVYLFSGSPFTSRTIFEGHAVRALYAASGAADYYLETGDAAYGDARTLGRTASPAKCTSRRRGQRARQAFAALMTANRDVTRKAARPSPT